MVVLDLVKITDTSGKTTGKINKVTYQALTDDEFDNLATMESDYSYIGWNFKMEFLGQVQIPSLEPAGE